jgi:hypothetical protein
MAVTTAIEAIYTMAGAVAGIVVVAPTPLTGGLLFLLLFILVVSWVGKFSTRFQTIRPTTTYWEAG